MVPLAGTPPVELTASDEPRERGLLLAIGNRLPHKNFVSLVRAIARIPEADRPRLVVTGSRGDDPLRPVVEELGVQQWVDLKGWVSDEELTWLYGHASALMVPNYCDGFCLPALEAMLVGLPVLMSDIPVYHEVGADAVGYFEPTDLDSIAAAMVRASSDPAWLDELSARGRVQTATFSWEKTARHTLELFERVLADPAHPRGRQG